MKEMICIVCPRGCHLKISEQADHAVTGNACPRGAEYAKNELLHPTRVVTSTVCLEGGWCTRLPVKTDRALPKHKIFECMSLLGTLKVHAPVKAGEILLSNICGTNVNIISTKTVAQSITHR